MNSRRPMWIAMRPSHGVMQRSGRYHTWTCCAAGFQTGRCRLGVKTRIRLLGAYVSFRQLRTCRRMSYVREVSLADSPAAINLLRLDTRGADDLAPLFGLLGNETGELGGRAREGLEADFCKASLKRRVSVTSSRPLMRSGSADPTPRYCTAAISMPVIVLNSSP